MSKEEEFDRYLKLIPLGFRGPIIDVLDTAYTVRRWCLTYDVPVDPQFIAEMTRLIMQQAAELQAADNALAYADHDEEGDGGR